ncbi:FHA domain-containing protein [Actinacidiphila glaucinigra]|uniref:FHA domain-containing protein n=1 Tax=Actinacidiphila glaucinigra TaxID=235986 RepID=UPI003D91F6A4
MPELVLELNGRTWALDPARSYSLGRDPQSDVVLDDARVSWRHATIRRGERGWVVEDLGSTNGTYVQGQRVHAYDVAAGATVNLGNATDGPRLSFSGGAAAGGDLYSAETALPNPQQGRRSWPAAPVTPDSGGPPRQGGWGTARPPPTCRSPRRPPVRTSANPRPASRRRRGRRAAPARRPCTATAARRPSITWCSAAS